MKGNVVVNSKVLPQSQGYVSSLIVGIEFVCVYIGECVFDGNVCIVPCNSLKKAKYFYYFVIFQKQKPEKNICKLHACRKFKRFISKFSVDQKK